MGLPEPLSLPTQPKCWLSPCPLPVPVSPQTLGSAPLGKQPALWKSWVTQPCLLRNSREGQSREYPATAQHVFPIPTMSPKLPSSTLIKGSCLLSPPILWLTPEFPILHCTSPPPGFPTSRPVWVGPHTFSQLLELTVNSQHHPPSHAVLQQRFSRHQDPLSERVNYLTSSSVVSESQFQISAEESLIARLVSDAHTSGLISTGQSRSSLPGQGIGQDNC